MKTIKVVAAVIRDHDRIFSTQRGYGEFKGGWEFPGGKVEAHETPQEALKREIMEELDTEIQSNMIILISIFQWTVSGVKSFMAILYSRKQKMRNG